jgi:glycosyltransferase involved in cell wall biosynthesis
MFSILIPSYNNLSYLKLCIKSIIDNSKFNHQIIVHVNEGTDGTLDYLKKSNIDFTFTNYNSGICEGINKASKLAKCEYFLYANDDIYFCPNCDEILHKEINKIGHNNFYLSGTMMNNGQITFDYGNDSENFNEKKFSSEYKNFNYYNFNGSTWAPTLCIETYGIK